MIIKEKIEQAKRFLKNSDIDCWITFVRETQLNGDPVLDFLAESDLTWHSAFIINESKAVAIIGKYDRETIENLNVYDEVYDFVQGVKEPFTEVLKEMKPENIALNYSVDSEICDGITHGMYLTIQSFLKEIDPGCKIVSAEPVISELREVKTASELENIKKAISETEEIFEKVTKFIKPGLTELDVALFMKSLVEEKKLKYAWDETVCPAVFTGPDTAEAHFKPTEKVIEHGHILNMDFGVKVNNYCSDMQRTFYIKEKSESNIPDEVIKGFDVLKEAVFSAKKAIKPGIKGFEIDKIARDIVTGGGYDEFPHGLGHQVGRYSHDGTALLGPKWEKYGSKVEKELKPGMVFTIEPRLKVKDRGIVTIEEMVLVTESGAEWLSEPQKELIVI